MNALTYSQSRSDLAKTMDRVCDDHSPIIITRKSQRSVVMISLEDYQALEETAYLLRSPKNARRLLESIAELQSGGGAERDLIVWSSSFPNMPGTIICTGNHPVVRAMLLIQNEESLRLVKKIDPIEVRRIMKQANADLFTDFLARVLASPGKPRKS
jgi:antitoxin YefM